ncbi:MAG TPA: hypothetical protein PLP33_31400 [Leptospiraceae bacterium]|nr:hypothetical protein [Leptospiraceae bacterium]HMW07759.1 hypothetical protein [Leptospiraceae bacterium]HMZ66839.1 hypothetical protein [Leptospiraceae bacterium]HNC59969.1 hypothetical protein [Leptospiraceae bacterium]HNF57943.1 hypothetical protein [Leptospiraceae bacterium]
MTTTTNNKEKNHEPTKPKRGKQRFAIREREREKVISPSRSESKSNFSRAILKEWFLREAVKPMLRGGFISIGFVIGIATIGLMAIAVTGTFNTFTSGTVVKASDINTNFATLKAAIESIPSQPSMRLIYETDLTGTQNNINVTGLDGNTDKEYMIVARIVSPITAACAYGIQPNGITGSSIYGFQYVGAGGPPSAIAGRNTNELFLNMTTNNTAGQVAYANSFMLAKTGASRVLHTLNVQQLAAGTSTIGDNYVFSAVWTDSTTNITSLNFAAQNNSCYGAGSHIEVWARR